MEHTYVHCTTSLCILFYISYHVFIFPSLYNHQPSLTGIANIYSGTSYIHCTVSLYSLLSYHFFIFPSSATTKYTDIVNVYSGTYVPTLHSQSLYSLLSLLSSGHLSSLDFWQSGTWLGCLPHAPRSHALHLWGCKWHSVYLRQVRVWEYSIHEATSTAPPLAACPSLVL